MGVIQSIHKGYYSENNIRYVFLDGNACTNMSQCFRLLQKQLSFPGYFGNNLDALDEMLADLAWIPEEKVKIILFHQESLLGSDTEKKKDFMEILSKTEHKKLELIFIE